MMLTKLTIATHQKLKKKKKHEPIGVRGFFRLFDVFFKIVGRRERTKGEKHMYDAHYFLFCSPMLHMLDSYCPLFSNMFQMLDYDVLYTCSYILP